MSHCGEVLESRIGDLRVINKECFEFREGYELGEVLITELSSREIELFEGGENSQVSESEFGEPAAVQSERSKLFQCE